MIFPFIGDAPIVPEPIQIVLEAKQTREIEEPAVRELTVEEKIATNYYECDESIEYIRADNAQCLPKPVQRVQRVQTPTTPSQSQTTVRRAVDASNTYVWGNCTWFIKNTVSWIPNGLGNANQWDNRARAMGFTVNSTPQVGSVGVDNSGYYGHVVQITGVNSDGTVNLVEMNYSGLGVITHRTAPATNFVYIHP